MYIILHYKFNHFCEATTFTQENLYSLENFIVLLTIFFFIVNESSIPHNSKCASIM